MLESCTVGALMNAQLATVHCMSEKNIGRAGYMDAGTVACQK